MKEDEKEKTFRIDKKKYTTFWLGNFVKRDLWRP